MDGENDSERHDELAKMRGKIEKLEMEKLLQGDEIRALKAEAHSYQDELRLLNGKVQSLEQQALQDTPATNIGKEVRLRYLERYRQRMGRAIGKLGYDRIKCGDRAAHRRRPIVDAFALPDRPHKGSCGLSGFIRSGSRNHEKLEGSS